MSGQRVTVYDTQGNGVEFTATVKESGRFAVDITEHPAETGAIFTDHARPKLPVLTLEAVVSDINGNVDNAASAALEFFLGLHSNPRPVEVVTPRLVYEVMAMQNLEVPRKKEDGRAQRFSVEFKKYETVSTLKRVVQIKLARPEKKGRQEKKPQIQEKKQTLLKKIKNGVQKKGAAGAVKSVAGL
jgi:hypothetical protein